MAWGPLQSRLQVQAEQLEQAVQRTRAAAPGASACAKGPSAGCWQRHIATVGELKHLQAEVAWSRMLKVG